MINTDSKTRERDLPFEELKRHEKIVRRLGDTIFPNSRIARILFWGFAWIFPIMLAGISYALDQVYTSFDFFRSWIGVNNWPLIFVLTILGCVWLVLDLIWIFSRETTSRQLQWNLMVTIFLACAFSITWGKYWWPDFPPWWFSISLFGALADAFGCGWGSINNATQKPFLSDRGKE